MQRCYSSEIDQPKKQPHSRSKPLLIIIVWSENEVLGVEYDVFSLDEAEGSTRIDRPTLLQEFSTDIRAVLHNNVCGSSFYTDDIAVSTG